MQTLGELRLARVLLAVLLLCSALPVEVLAQTTPGGSSHDAPSAPGVVPENSAQGAAATDSAAVPAAADSAQWVVARAEQTLAESRELLKSGDYDRAIEILKAALGRGPYPVALQRDLYLQLIKTYVTLGNDLKFRPQGREMSNLNYRAAREWMVECLSVPALRHTKPEPATDYPPEMVRLFGEVRTEVFGAFRVVGVEPVTATVLFDGDTLRLSADCVRGDDDLKVGPHRVTVMAPRYRAQTETVTISPGATLERSYGLTKKRGTRWYVTRGVLAAGVGVGLGLLLGRGTSTSAPPGESPLPPAPPPPAR